MIATICVEVYMSCIELKFCGQVTNMFTQGGILCFALRSSQFYFKSNNRGEEFCYHPNKDCLISITWAIKSYMEFQNKSSLESDRNMASIHRWLSNCKVEMLKNSKTSTIGELRWLLHTWLKTMDRLVEHCM